MKIKFLLVTAPLLASVALVGCSDTKQVKIANPASEYCVSISGNLTIEKTAEGEHGICTLASGETIEEWALFRRDHKEEKPQ